MSLANNLGGRVAFNKNFIGGRGYFKPPTPLPYPPKLMYAFKIKFQTLNNTYFYVYE